MVAISEFVLLSYFYTKHSNRLLLFLKFVLVNLWTAWRTRVFTVPHSQRLWKTFIFITSHMVFHLEAFRKEAVLLDVWCRRFSWDFFVFEGIPWKVENPAVVWCWWQTFSLIWVCFLIGSFLHIPQKERKSRKPAEKWHEHCEKLWAH